MASVILDAEPSCGKSGKAVQFLRLAGKLPAQVRAVGIHRLSCVILLLDIALQAAKQIQQKPGPVSQLKPTPDFLRVVK